MACATDVKSEWNDFLEDCAGNAAKIRQKRKQDKIDKVEGNAQSLYNRFKKEIEDDNTIKNCITDAMSLGYNAVYFYGGSYSVACAPKYRMRKYDELDSQYFKKVFETKAYGDKILIDLLREKFQLPIKVSITHKSFANRDGVKIEWKKK